jgi:hypothetical protein
MDLVRFGGSFLWRLLPLIGRSDPGIDGEAHWLGSRVFSPFLRAAFLDRQQFSLFPSRNP